MLIEIDELDQFRITVQHLEVCRELILDGGEAKWRSALILLDHVCEIILYRVVTDEFAYDDSAQRVLPERYPRKERRQIRRSFPSKLKVVAETNKLPATVSSALGILHSYRNATYHNDKHNPAVLEIIARIAFVATADLLSRTRAGFKNMGIGGQTDPVDWLQRYGLSDSLIWFQTVATKIADQLKKGVRPRLSLVKSSFATDVVERVAAIRGIIVELFPNGPKHDIDRLLKWYEFKRSHPDLENRLSQRLRELNYKIGSGHGNEVNREEYQAAETQFRRAYDREFKNFAPTCRYEDLDAIQHQSTQFQDEKNFRSALDLYAGLDRQLTSFEESTTRAYIEMEWAAEMQADIARGK